LAGSSPGTHTARRLKALSTGTMEGFGSNCDSDLVGSPCIRAGAEGL
jgi:hypothetical protein